MADLKPIQHETSKVRYWDYQPGNGTRYDLIAVSLEPLGQPGQWLVSLRNMGGCMTVTSGGYLSRDYVAEKLVPRYGRLLGGDLDVLATGIMKLVD